jgi:hypothetical protein
VSFSAVVICGAVCRSRTVFIAAAPLVLPAGEYAQVA